MTNQQGAPEALRLAELLELAPEDGVEPQTTEDAAAELRRQHTRIAELEARIKTMAEEHADELMVAHMDGRMRAAQPAGSQQPGDCGNTPYDEGPFTLAQQPGAAYAEPQFPAHPESMVMDWSALEIRVIAQYGRDMYEAGKRASHGKAPAQAIPAAVARCTRSHPHENMDSACRAKAAIAEMQNMAARGAEATAHDLDRFVAMLAAAPTTQPAPQQEPDEIRSYAAARRAWIASAARAPANSVLDDAAPSQKEGL